MGVRMGIIYCANNVTPVILSLIISWGNALWLCSPDILSCRTGGIILSEAVTFFHSLQ